MGGNENVSKVRVDEITEDPLYVGGRNYNSSFAILTLSESVDTTTVCLPAENPRNYIGKVATVTGWGVEIGYSRPDNLQEVHVTVISIEECRETWSSKGHWIGTEK